MGKYRSDQAGSNHYAEKMAALADAYPEFAERAETEGIFKKPEPTPEPAPAAKTAESILPKNHTKQIEAKTVEDLLPKNGKNQPDKSARAFVKTSTDTEVFGVIDEAIANESKIEAGEIKLQAGFHVGDKLTGKGFGDVHIAKGHGDEIWELGYTSIADFVEDVATNKNEIYRQENGRLLLVKRNGKNKLAVIELDPESGGFYSVGTAYTKQKSKRIKGDLLWSRRTFGSSPTGEGTLNNGDSI